MSFTATIDIVDHIILPQGFDDPDSPEGVLVQDQLVLTGRSISDEKNYQFSLPNTDKIPSEKQLDEWQEQGVKVTVDQGSPIQVPFNWCLTNICIAARGIEPTVAAQMEAGQQLKLELTDLYSSSVAINMPLAQFGAVHQGPPAETFDFGLTEE